MLSSKVTTASIASFSNAVIAIISPPEYRMYFDFSFRCVQLNRIQIPNSSAIVFVIVYLMFAKRLDLIFAEKSTVDSYCCFGVVLDQIELSS